MINGAVIGGFTFTLDDPSSDACHWRLRVNHSELGTPDVDAAVEFARRTLACAPERLRFIESPVDHVRVNDEASFVTGHGLVADAGSMVANRWMISD